MVRKWWGNGGVMGLNGDLMVTWWDLI
jgi:hypothetical protein